MKRSRRDPAGLRPALMPMAEAGDEAAVERAVERILHEARHELARRRTAARAGEASREGPPRVRAPARQPATAQARLPRGVAPWLALGFVAGAAIGVLAARAGGNDSERTAICAEPTGASASPAPAADLSPVAGALVSELPALVGPVAGDEVGRGLVTPRPAMTRAHLADYLELTEEQRERVDGIFRRYDEELDGLTAELGPRVDALEARRDEEVDALLSAEQRDKLARLRSRMSVGSGPRPVPHGRGADFPGD
jgi:hypothetical protein